MIGRDRWKNDPIRRCHLLSVEFGQPYGLASRVPARRRLPGQVAVVDPDPFPEYPSVHWSYWSDERTLFDSFAVGEWRHARVGNKAPESLAPYTLRLVRSGDIFSDLAARLECVPMDWLRTAARSIRSHGGGGGPELYEVSTDADVLRARWVFDSACGVGPAFPVPRAFHLCRPRLPCRYWT